LSNAVGYAGIAFQNVRTYQQPWAPFGWGQIRQLPPLAPPGGGAMGRGQVFQ